MRNTNLHAAKVNKKDNHIKTMPVAKVSHPIKIAYLTTIDLARESNSPIEFVCGSFNCGDCEECKTCETVRTAEEWEQRYRMWKESVNAVYGKSATEDTVSASEDTVNE